MTRKRTENIKGKEDRDYCVCIRTLGKAGEKYQTLLDSLKRQTVQPKKILVYIPYGYDLPKETIGVEQYVRCEKGMVYQRSLPFDEVDTNWILFLDDDVYMEDDAVESLFSGLEAGHGDAISANVFRVQEAGWLEKLKAAMVFTFPRFDDGWAIKLWRNGSHTYNSNPTRPVLPSQSAAGPTLLVRKKAFQSIHYSDERWMDAFRYPLGEDMALAYKLYLYGYRLLVHYDAGCVHLDAKTGNETNSLERFRIVQTVWLVRWYRIFYNLKHSTWKSKVLAVASYSLRELWTFFFGALSRSIKNHDIKFILVFFEKYKKGYDIIHSKAFRSLPRYDEYLE